LSGGSEFLALLGSDFGVGEVQGGESIDDGGCDDDAGEPFIIGGHDVPRGLFGGGVTDHLLVGCHVVVPEPAFTDVGGGELPVFGGIIQAFEEAAFLFLFGNMEEELTDDDSVAGEVAFEVADICEAVFPDLRGDQLRGQLLAGQQFGVHTDDEGLFVVTAVEDADMAAVGQHLETTPQVIVIELLGGRRFEGMNVASLGVHAGHDVFDGAVFTGGVHGLEDQQHSPAVLGVEHVLEPGEGLDADGEGFLGAGFIFGAETEGVGGVEAFESEPVSLGDAKWAGQLACFTDEGLEFDGAGAGQRSHVGLMRGRVWEFKRIRT
jgi:hypothetical protein